MNSSSLPPSSTSTYTSPCIKLIQQRNHGARYNSKNLPPRTPIVGLGCSSFSTFFSSSNETEEDSQTQEGVVNQPQEWDNITQQTVQTILQPKSHPTIQKWINTIHYAISNGITLLDTAPWYGHGSSEVVIGYAMDGIINNRSNSSNSSNINNSNNINNNNSCLNVNRNDLIINTKVGRYESDPMYQFDFSYEMTIRSVKRSIERMKCSYIDVIQLHDPEFVPDLNMKSDKDMNMNMNSSINTNTNTNTNNIDILIKETIPALLYCRDEIHIVKAIGLTGYPLEVQYHILNRVEEMDIMREGAGVGVGVVFDQCLTYCHFNLHSQALFTKKIESMNHLYHRHPDSDSDSNKSNKSHKMSFAQYCHSKSIPLMAAAPLSMGLLTHKAPPEWHPAPTSLRNACHNASIIATNNDVNLPTLAILFALVHGSLSCTLLGMSSVKEVDAVLAVIKRIENVKYEDNDNDHDNDNDDNTEMLRNDILSVLNGILTENEKVVLKLLFDKTNGPFAEVWSSGEYEWDGVDEAEKFWLEVSGGGIDKSDSDKAKFEAAERMRRR